MDELTDITMLEENTPDNSYDENGNPIEYINQKYKWNTGRNLESITNVQSDGTEKEYLSFTYDEKGIRTSKKYGSVTYNYTSKDGNITSQYQATKYANPKEPTSIYLYDSNDNIIGMTYRNNPYFFIKNHMGDVIGMVTQDGTWVRSYYYDAWGNDIGTTVNTDLNVNESAAATVNPFRYRGYYYDEQSKMYYLQSRYYRPDTFRFLNADLPEFAKAQKDVYAGINLFAYCCNDPVNNSDYEGTWGASVHNGYNKSTKSANKTTVKGGYYYYGTYYWALECGFSIDNAKLLGEFCIELDKKYPSTRYAAMKYSTDAFCKVPYPQSQLNEYKRWQYFHFNKNTSGQDSRTSFCISRRNWAVDKWNQGQYKKALNYLGYAIHAVQDYHSHGQIGRGLDIPQHVVPDAKNNHNKKDVADNINYVWADSGWKLLKEDSYNKTRLVRTGIETKKFIKVFLSRIKNKNMIKGTIR